MENNAITRAYKISSTIKKINTIFEAHGFQKIYLPMYEYYDVLKNAVRDFTDENIIRFIDRVTGKSMVLRPDFTPQVCRNVATYIDCTPIPVKLYYNGRVFRNVHINQGQKSEKYQCGGEILGIGPFFGEMELLLVINECLESLQLRDARIILGDMKLLELIISQLPSYREEIIKILISKELDILKMFVDKLTICKELKELILSLPLAIGDVNIINDLSVKAKFNKDISQRLSELSTFFHNLESFGLTTNNIIFDASELRGFNYYTGINYDIVYGDRGTLLGGGGRYDNLMNIFGYNISACGLAFDIDEIISYSEDQIVKKEIDFLIVGKENIDKLFELRRSNHTVLYIDKADNLEHFNSAYIFKNIIK